MMPICDESFFDNFRPETIFYDLNHEIWGTAVYNGSSLTLSSKYKKSDFVVFRLRATIPTIPTVLTVYSRINSKSVHVSAHDVSPIGQVLTLENPLILDLIKKQSSLALDEQAFKLSKQLNRVEMARKNLQTDWPFKPKKKKK